MDINTINHAKTMYILFNDVNIVLFLGFVVVGFFSILIISSNCRRIKLISCLDGVSEIIRLIDIADCSRKIKWTLILAFIYVLIVIASIKIANHYKSYLISHGISPQQIERMVEANHNGR